MKPRVFIVEPMLKYATINHPQLVVRLDNVIVCVGLIREENPICFWVEGCHDVTSIITFNSKQAIVEYFSTPTILEKISQRAASCST